LPLSDIEACHINIGVGVPVAGTMFKRLVSMTQAS